MDIKNFMYYLYGDRPHQTARIMYRFAYGPYKSTGRVQLPVRVILFFIIIFL